MLGALLLVLAVADDPAAALEQLARFGEVPECRATESIERHGSDHAHRFAPPRVLPALAGAYAELLPYLEHSNRKVVLRAVLLMCHTGAAQAPAQLLALARRFPCEPELTRSAIALSLTEVPTRDCPADAVPAWQATARALAQWKQPGQAATVTAIAAGDTRLLQRTLWDLEALDPARVQQAAATLAQLDAPPMFLPTVKGLRQLLGNQFARELEVLWRGILSAQLANIAAKLQLEPPAAFCAIAGGASVEDFELLQSLRMLRARSGQDDLPRAAETARQARGLSAFGREYLEELASADSHWKSEAISKMVDHRDRPALRAFFQNETNQLRDRLEAARSLAVLGDASGLALFASPAGLWPEAHQRRRALLLALASQSPPAVREQAQALLARSWTN